MAEAGIPAALFLVLFYGLTLWRNWRLICDRDFNGDPALQNFGCMAVAGIIGFSVSSTFISTSGVEIAYYVALLGAGALKLASQTDVGAVDARDELDNTMTSRP
jgi:hypothetical protein